MARVALARRQSFERNAGIFQMAVKAFELTVALEHPAHGLETATVLPVQNDRMVVFITSEKHRSVASLADAFKADDVAVEFSRAIEIADVQLYITKFSIADHDNAPSLMS